MSEQISTAGYEASGTSNMKFALNGALTIGTLDGANIEIMEAVGAENIYIFGLTAEEVSADNPYDPREFYAKDPLLKETVDLIRRGFFNPAAPDLFHPLIDDLLNVDRFRNLNDFEAYHQAQMQIDRPIAQYEAWTRKSISMWPAWAGFHPIERLPNTTVISGMQSL